MSVGCVQDTEMFDAKKRKEIESQGSRKKRPGSSSACSP